MNSNGCSYPFATDEIFFSSPNLCDTNLIVYWTVLMTIVGVRLVLTGQQILQWQARNKQLGLKNRLPIGVSLSVTQTISFFLLFLLCGLNLLNSQNAGSFAVYILSYLSFSVDFTMLLYKLVKLGKKIIPISTMEIGNNKHVNKLDTFTPLGKILFAIQCGSICVTTLVFLVLFPSFPRQLAFGYIGWASMGCFQSSCTLGTVYQFHRCASAIKRSMTSTAGSRDNVVGVPKGNTAQFLKVVLTLRLRALLAFLVGNSIAIVYILMAADVITWNWYATLVFPAAGETLNRLFVNCSQMRRSHKSRNNRDQQTTTFVRGGAQIPVNNAVSLASMHAPSVDNAE